MKDLSAAVEAELKKQGVSREEAQELTLNECRVSDLSILKGLDALEVLSICVSDLKTLEGFPPLPSLVKLDVSDNKIVDGLQSLAACPKLAKVILDNNRVASVEQIEALKDCKALESLSLENNPVAGDDGYPKSVWDALPNLKVLDHCDRTGAEVSEEEDDEYDEEDDDDYEEEGDDGGGDAEPGLAALPAFRFPFGGTDKGVSSCLQFDDNPDEGDEDSYQAEQEEASEDISEDADEEDEEEGGPRKRAKYADDEEEDDE